MYAIPRARVASKRTSQRLRQIIPNIDCTFRPGRGTFSHLQPRPYPGRGGKKCGTGSAARRRPVVASVAKGSGGDLPETLSVVLN